MRYLIACMLMVPSVALAEPVVDDEAIIHHAKHNCPGIKPSKVKESILRDLMAVENRFSPPASLKGMTLAAACFESKYNPTAKGDYRKVKNRRVPMAIGILQQWPWVERFYKINRRNHKEATSAWMQHIVRQLHYVKKKCKWRSPHRRWIAAWVTAIRYPKKGGRCHERPKHLKVLKRWHRAIKLTYDEDFGC